MFELRLLCPEGEVQALGEALEAIGALSVSIEDADAGTHEEQELFCEPGSVVTHEAWQHSRVLALFAARPAAEAAACQLRAGLNHPGCGVLGVFELPDQDWVRLTQSQFAPVEIAADFWIVPSWHEPPKAARHIIRLDPGLAFGTGTHPTTRMCLRWIARRPNAFRRVLDYGCGSGVLAIGAVRHGAVDVDAVDIDLAAINAAGANAVANDVRLRVGRPNVADGQYDLVLANILASPLKVLAPLLCSRVARGGRLVLAGILERQAEELIQAYAAYASLEVADTEDGWILMTAAL